jgi:subtilisin family serine protease
MRVLRTFVLLAALVLGALVAPPTLVAAEVATTPVLVTLSPGAGAPAAAAARLASEHGATVSFVYQHALRGFAAEVPTASLEALARSPAVVRVEEDGPVTIASEQVQLGPTWGLDRIDQRVLPLDSAYGYARNGTDVRAYIVDTGVRASHDQLRGRVTTGWYDPTFAAKTSEDCNGHGTHVAATVAGTAYGVGKSVAVVPVRVLDCNGSGSWSGVAAGLDWIVGQQRAAGKPAAVANLSLSGGASDTVDAALRSVIAEGVTVAVAAGNGNQAGRAIDACKISPARVAEALTVSATNSSDTKPTWANIGPCVDLFAPGVSITSAWYTSDSDTNTISGTSMATPHVAGVAALLQSDGALAPAVIASSLVGGATPNVVVNAGSGSPNLLLYSRLGVNASGGTLPPANEPPVASFTFGCDQLTCNFDGSGSTDPDGEIVRYTWTFGDGGTGTGTPVSNTYGASGSYTVRLTVTDDAGATGSTSEVVTVDAGGSVDTIAVLATLGAKVRAMTPVTLTWTDPAGTSWTVARDGQALATVTEGRFSESLRGGGTVTYRVCRTGSSICGEVQVTY